MISQVGGQIEMNLNRIEAKNDSSQAGFFKNSQKNGSMS
jgi:hypothetical protein